MKEKSQPKELDCYNSLCSHVRTKWPVALLVFSLILLFLIVLFKWVVLDWIIDTKVAESIRLVPGSSTWDKWINITVPIFLKFCLFNVTNPLEVMNGGKPRVQEMGPYVYEEKRMKKVLRIDKERDTVAYRQRTSYHFRPDLSHGSENDRLVLINVPLVSVASSVRQRTNLPIAYGIADQSLRQRGERLFTYHTVREYLFDGWSVEPYISFLTNPLLQLVQRVKIPDSFSGGKFGFYKNKNNTDNGEMVVRTGVTNSKEFGRIMSWNGQTQLDHWNGTCNLINGTDGSVLPPFINKKDYLRFFIPDVCRSVAMIFEKERELRGVRSYRFVLPDPEPVFNDPDFCFCPKDKKQECYKTGVFSLSPCKENAPVAVSAPHFYQAWEPYQNAVLGLNPNRKDHATFLDVEPKTGLILNAAKRLQFNVKLESNPYTQTFARVPNMLFPIMWVEEAAEITEEILSEVRSQLYDSVEMAETASFAGLLACCLFILLGIFGCCMVNCNDVAPPPAEHSIDPSDRKLKSGAIFRTESSSSWETRSSIANQKTMPSFNKSTMTDFKHREKRGIHFEPYSYISSTNEMEEKVSNI